MDDSHPSHRSRFRPAWSFAAFFAACGLGAFVVLGAASSLAFGVDGAVSQTPASTERAAAGLVAPAESAQVWVDVEGAAARTGVTAIAVRAGDKLWALTDATATPLGFSGARSVVPGVIDVRFTVETDLTADIAVTFVDTDGRVLNEHLLRSAKLAQGSSTWADVTASEGPSPGGQGEGDTSGPGTATAKNPLSGTGGERMLPYLIGAGVLVIAGAAIGVIAAAKRRTRGAADSVAPGEPETEENGGGAL